MAILLLIVAVCAVYTAYYYLIFRRRYPIGPFPLPLIGNVYHIKPDYIHEYMDELGAKYGHCYTLFLPTPTVIMTNEKFIKEALVGQGEKFAGRTHLPPETHLQRKENIGVLISDGENWKAQRKTSLRIFRNFGVGRNLMEQQINSSIDEMIRELDGSENKKAVDIYHPIQLCVGNVINKMLFGFHYEYSQSKKFFEFVHILNTHLEIIRDSKCGFFVQAWPWLKHVPIIGYYGYWRQKENISGYLNFIEDQVVEHQKTFDVHAEPENFVHAYLKEMETGTERLDIENLSAVCVDFWLAGMETTSTTLRWHIAYMINYPEVQAKVQQEIDSVVGTRPPTMTDKVNMPYTSAVILEVQRACNMVAFLNFHRCTEETEVFGHPIPKDAIVMPQIWSVMSSDCSFEDAKAFRPERFLNEDGKTFNKKAVDSNVVFGLGKRQCVGEALAKMELFLIFTSLMQKFRFSPNVAKPDLRANFSSVLAPKHFKCQIETRI